MSAVLFLLALSIFLLYIIFHDGNFHRAAKSQIPALAKVRTISLPYEPSPIIPSSIAPWEAGDTNEDVAICIAVKDQYPDLTEWLVHHYTHHHIRRFYILDDGSSPPLATRNFSQYIDERAITHRYYLPTLRTAWPQMQYYEECVKLFGHKHKWLGFLDTDEFLEAKPPYTLHNMLKDLDHSPSIGALAINWVMHNSNNLTSRPQTSIRKAFTSCLADSLVDHGPDWGSLNQHIKVFVRPHAFLSPAGPHKMYLHPGYVTVGENGDVVTRKAWRVPASKKKLALHHYGVRSWEEYRQKMERGNAMNDPKGEAFWDEVEGAEREECLEMALYKP